MFNRRSGWFLTAFTSLARLASAQWTPQASGVTVELRGLSVVSQRVAWASGQRGTVIHTTDGGEHWIADTIPGAAKLDLRAIEATSPTVAHAMSIGDSSRIFRTTDAGKTWTQQFIFLKKGSFLDAIRFWDAKHGIAISDPVEGHFLVVTTDDGGDTWQEIPADVLPAALPGEGMFAASGSCLTVYGNGDAWFATGGAPSARVLHTADRGKTWTVSEAPIRAGVAAAGIFSVAFRDGQHGAASGGDYTKAKLGGRNLALTSDGGRTWTVVDSATSPQGYRSAVAFAPGSNGRMLVAVGLSGTDVSSDGGRTWTSTDSVAYNSVQMVSPTSGFAVGPRGRVGRFDAVKP